MFAQTNLWIFLKIKIPRLRVLWTMVDCFFFQYGQVEEIINGFESKTHEG
jgi:hypothetical protein